MPKAILFDYGGTLVTSVGTDIMPYVVEGAKHAHTYLLQKRPDAPNFNTFYQAAANALQSAYMAVMGSRRELQAREVIDELLADLDVFLSDEEFDNFTREWHKPFREKTALLDGAEECLKTLKGSGLKLGIISNTIWPPQLLDEELKRLEIRDYFDCVVASSGFGVKKPYPDIFEKALSELGVEAGETFFVGDSLKEDVAGAGMLGMKTILLDWKHEEIPGITPDAKIESLSELPSAVEKLQG
jgi:putative hydrolase of the HAD superfamily